MASIRQVTTSPALTAGSVSIIEALASYIFKNGSVAPYATNNTYMKGDWIVDNSTSVIKLRVCNEDSVTGTYNAAKWTDVTFDFDRNRWNSSQLAKLTEEDGTPIYLNASATMNHVDKITKSGIYDFSVDFIGGTPNNLRGILVASVNTDSAGLGTQVFTASVNNGAETYFRSRVNNTWSEWERVINNSLMGSMLLGNKFVDVTTTGYKGKVAGSLVENSNVVKVATSVGIITPSAYTVETSQAGYNGLVAPGGTTLSTTNPTNGVNSQHLFMIDLISHVQKTYGLIPGATTADKVLWLKANISFITFNWFGFGSSPSGNKASLKMFYNNVWSNLGGVPSHTSATASKLVGLNSVPAATIQNDGFVYFGVYAEASNGTVASTLTTDFAEVQVEMSTDIITNLMEATSSTKGLMSPSDKAKLDAAQQLKLVNNDGTALTPANGTNFDTISESGFYRYSAPLGHTGGPTVTGTQYWLVIHEVFNATSAVQTWKSVNSFETYIRIKTNGVWQPYRRQVEFNHLGSAVLGNKVTDTSAATFNAKTAANLTTNPHIAKANGMATTLYNPSGSWAEFVTADTLDYSYPRITTLNGSTTRLSANGTGTYAQKLFAFNIIEHIERTYGVIAIGSTLADKVAWAKENITKMIFNFWGYGTNPAGSKNTVQMWNSLTSQWYGALTSTSSTVAKIARTAATKGDIQALIDANGMIHFMAYTDASDGVTSSVLYTDYVELLVDIATDIRTNIPVATPTLDGLMRKEDKDILDKAQQHRLTKNDGYLNIEADGSDLNAYRKTGFFQFTNNTVNAPEGFVAGILETYAVNDTYVIQEFLSNTPNGVWKFNRILSSGTWSEWERYVGGTETMSTILGKPLLDRSVANLKGKIAGSAVVNPHFARRVVGSTVTTPVLTGELTQAEYNNLAAQEGTNLWSNVTTTGQFVQHQFSFNLIQHIERKYFTIPGATTADKVAWIKLNVAASFVWTGYGVNAGGNKASLVRWSPSNAAFYGVVLNTSSTPTKLISTIPEGSMSSFVDATGYVHFVAYSESANGTVASVLYTDFVELYVDLKSDILSALPEATQSAKGLLSASDKTKLDNAQQWKLTDNSGRLLPIPNSDANVLLGTRQSGLYLASSTTKNLPDTLDSSAYHGTLQVVERTDGSVQHMFTSYTGRSFHRYALNNVIIPGRGADSNGWTEYAQKQSLLELTMGGTYTELSSANFKSKVAGSLVANPHMSRGGASSALLAPTDPVWNEGLIDYTKFNELDTTVGVLSTLTNGNKAQQIITFDLIKHLEKLYVFTVPGSTTAEKAEWVRKNISNLNINVHGKGSSPTGNRLSVAVWTRQSQWAGLNATTNNWITKITYPLSGYSAMAFYVMDDGYIHFLAYAEASNGTVASEMQVDYVDLTVQLTTSILNGLQVQKAVLTGDDGNAIPATDFYALMKPGFYKLDGVVKNAPTGAEISGGAFTATVTYVDGMKQATAFDRTSRQMYTSLYTSAGWAPWKKLIDNGTLGNALFNNGFVDTTITSFTGKVAGSTTANPHIIKASASTALVDPASFGAEIIQSRYDKMKILDDNFWSITNATATNILQVLFSFNLIEHVQRTYGTIPATTTADKAAWLRRNISRLFFNTWISGSAAPGNKVSVTRWNGSAYAVTTVTHSLATQSKLSYGLVPGLDIDASGFVHFIAYTEAASASVQAALNISYSELQVELKTTMQENIPTATQTSNGLLSKEDKTILDNGQQKALTKPSGGAMNVPNNTDFDGIVDSGLYVYSGGNGHKGAPTASTYWTVEVKEFDDSVNVTQIWYDTLKDEVYSRRLNASGWAQFRREIDAKEFGGILFGTKFSDKSFTNFANKIAGATAGSPHIARRTTSSNSSTFTTLNAPDNSGYIEWSQSQYDAIKKVDGSSSVIDIPLGALPVMAQHIFSFNLIEHINRVYGITPGSTTAEKVAWLKNNLTKITFNWWGFGSSTGGFKANVNMYNVSGSTWHTNPISNTSSTPTLVQFTRANTNSPALINFIDASGFVHFIAYTEPTDNTVKPTINTDFVDLQVELSADYQDNLRRATTTNDGLMTKEDKARLDKAQAAMLTADNGQAITLATGTNINDVINSGYYYVYTANHVGPFPAAHSYYTLNVIRLDSSNVYQIMYTTFASEVYVRRRASGVWTDWRRNTDSNILENVLMGNKITDNSTANFVSKVSGSVVNNPHAAYRKASNPIGAPAEAWVELVDGTTALGYGQIMSHDGAVASQNTAGFPVGSYAQHRFTFNIIEHVQRSYGTIPGSTIAEKITWIKANISKVTMNWWGYGSSPVSNKVVLKPWSVVSSIYANFDSGGSPNHSNTTTTKLSGALTVSFGNVIDTSGNAHFIVYADASDASTQSVINTEYVELLVELTTDIKSNLPRASATADGLMTKEDKAQFDVSQHYALTADSGLNKSTVNNLNFNDLTDPGFYAVSVPMVNGPEGFASGTVIVYKNQMTTVQIAFANNNFQMWTRWLSTYWRPWRKQVDTNAIGQLLLNNKWTDTSVATFAAKVAGSTSLNANKARRAGVTALIAPNNAMTEFEQNRYDGIMQHDGNVMTHETTTAGNFIAQNFTFDLITHIENVYGAINGANAAEKVAWLKANLSKVTFNYWGYATGPVNKLTIKAWNGASYSPATGAPENTTTDVARRSITLNNSEIAAGYLDATGMMYFTAYSDPADATTKSVIYMEYVDLKVEMTTDIRTNLPEATSTLAGLMSASDKSLFDASQRYRMTQDSGSVLTVPNGTDFAKLNSSGSYRFSPAAGHYGSPDDARYYNVVVLRHDSDNAVQLWNSTNGDTMFYRRVNSTGFGAFRKITDTNMLGAAILNANFVETFTANFMSKTAGSTGNNPHVAKAASGPTLTLYSAGTEFAAADYAKLNYLDAANTTFGQTATAGNMAQHLFAFNVYDAVQRSYGTIPGTTVAEKVDWLKSHVTKVTFNWWGFGSNPAGNKATIGVWNAVTSAYATITPGTASAVAKQTYQVTGGGISNIINASGFVQFIAYGDPSDGTTPSVIQTDYTEVVIEMTTKISDNIPMVSSAQDGLMSKDDKVALDAAQKIKITQDTGAAKTISSDNVNTLVQNSHVGEHLTTSSTKNLPENLVTVERSGVLKVLPRDNGFVVQLFHSYEGRTFFRYMASSAPYLGSYGCDSRGWIEYTGHANFRELAVGGKTKIRSAATFENKVSASLTANPHLFKMSWTATLLAPSSYTFEAPTSDYLKVSNDDGQVVTMTTNLSTASYPVTLFSFNMLEHVQRLYKNIPGATTADKITWLKANITKMQFHWKGYGVSPTGNKATVVAWRNDLNAWNDFVLSNTATIPTSIQYVISTPVEKYIDVNGFVHFLAYAEKSTTSVQSTVYTACAELLVELSPDMKASIQTVTTATDGLMSKEDKDILDNAQKMRLTSDTGRSKATVTDVDTISSPGVYYTAISTLNTPTVGSYFVVEHLLADSATTAIQRATEVLTGSTYYRTKTSTGWRVWERVTDAGQLGNVLMGNKLVDSMTLNYNYKVAGSTTANPHTMGYSSSSALMNNPASVSESTQAQYNNVMTLDSAFTTVSTSTTGAIAQIRFGFNLIEHVQRVYGTIPGTTADKVAWLKTYVTKLTFLWTGYGSGPAGNKATTAAWIGSSGTWYVGNSHTSATAQKTQFFINSDVGTWIDSNGFMNYLAYADASDGSTPTLITTDYVELQVELSIDIKTNIGKATTSSDGLMSKEDKAALDTAQKYKLTENDGRAKTLGYDTDLNSIVEPGQYMTSTVVNSPFPGTGYWYFVEVMKHNDKYISQRATRFASGGDILVYTRQMDNSLWLPWKRSMDNSHIGAIVMNNKMVDRTLATFVGKVAASNSENPHIFARGSGTTLNAPGTWIENSQSAYDQIKTIDGVNNGYNITLSSSMAQQFFGFNVIAHIERSYGSIPGATIAEKVTWIKNNVATLRFNWWGFGINPSGNKATIQVWSKGTSAWTTPVTHTSASTTKLTIPITVSGSTTGFDNDGMLYFIAYADPSNVTVSSTISTEYVELIVELNTDIRSSLPNATPALAGLMSAADKAAFDNAQKYKLTDNAGNAQGLPAGTDLNTVKAAGVYYLNSAVNAPGAGITGWVVVVPVNSNYMYQEFVINTSTLIFEKHIRLNYNGTWGPWKKQMTSKDIMTALFGNKLSDINYTNFFNKVAASFTENTNLARQNAYNYLLSPYSGPSIGAEFSTASYDKIASLDASGIQYTNTSNGNMVQQFFNFNLLEYVQRIYGPAPAGTLADQAKWLRTVVTKLVVNWWGFGSSPAGNKATLAVWTSDNQWATVPVSHTAGTTTKLIKTITTSLAQAIDDTGNVWAIVYADPSDGTTPSSIFTDYIELYFDVSTDIYGANASARLLANNGIAKPTSSFSQDANKIFESGYYTTDPSTINGPVDGSYGVLFHVRRHDGNFLQTWTNNIDSAMYTRAFHQDSVYWTSWKRVIDSNVLGTVLTGGTYPDTSQSYYGNKTSGSLSGNVNIAYADASVSTPLAIGAFTTELTTNQYKQIAVDSTDPLITTTPVTTAGVTGKIAQQLFAFDLIGHFNKLYGTTPGISVADKVVWLKRAVNKLTFRWSGRAAGTTAKATINRWSTTTNNWASGTAHSNTQQTTLSLSATGTLVAPYITATGHVYFIAYSDTATTTAGATLTTNFVELDVELNLDMATTTRPIWIDLPLKNNWTAYPKDAYTNTIQTPQYTLSKDGWVSFRGALSRSSTSEWWSTLPAEIRPARDILFPAPSNSKTMGRIFIRPSGEAHGYTAYDVDGTQAWLLDLNSVRYNIYE